MYVCTYARTSPTVTGSSPPHLVEHVFQQQSSQRRLLRCRDDGVRTWAQVAAVAGLLQMEDFQTQPDVGHYNAGIRACEKGGEWQIALSLLSLMPAATVAPNLFSFNGCIRACEKCDQWQMALWHCACCHRCRQLGLSQRVADDTALAVADAGAGSDQFQCRHQCL